MTGAIKHFFSKHGGVIIASVYGLVMRIFFEVGFGESLDFYNLFSITFIWILPVIIGVIPMLLASKAQLESFTYRLTRPIMAVFLFFVFCFWSGREDIVCIIIISIPFLIGAALGGCFFGELVENYRKSRGTLYSFLLIPFVTGLLENQFPTPTNSYEIKTSVIIHASASDIWKNVVRVSPIAEKEYNKGFFNYAGIPRPMYAELDKDTIGATRTGHFDGGLIFRETVTSWKKDQEVSFDIQVIPASIEETVFDKHILKGDHFKFLNASYKLEPINAEETKLILSSVYQLDTKLNFYGSYWGNQLLTDFQERLLEVIRNRSENKKSNL